MMWMILLWNTDDGELKYVSLKNGVGEYISELFRICKEIAQLDLADHFRIEVVRPVRRPKFFDLEREEREAVSSGPHVISSRDINQIGKAVLRVA